MKTEVRQPFFLIPSDNKTPKLPFKRSGDVGYDLYAPEDILLEQAVTVIPLGIGFANRMIGIAGAHPEHGYYAQICGRSSLALKGIFPIGGVIDASYRGEIGVTLAKLTPGAYRISKGEKIAQLVFVKVLDDVEIVEHDKSAIEQTERGSGGFGSTGK